MSNELIEKIGTDRIMEKWFDGWRTGENASHGSFVFVATWYLNRFERVSQAQGTIVSMHKYRSYAEMWKNIKKYT